MSLQIISRWTLLGALLAAMLIPITASAAKKSDKEQAEAAPKVVELFAAMESGEIEVTLIQKDSKGGNVLIKNKTGQPITIKLPEAFAGVPVLAQFGGGMGMGGGMGGMGGMGGGGMGGMGGMGGGGMGGGQGTGGGFGGGGGMGGDMGGGFGGEFNVAADKVGKLPVTTVCLEHGKPEPHPRMKYQLVPIESFTDRPEVIELCKMVGRGEIPQSAAQAAAWHVANGLSWAELAHKDRIRLRNGYTEKYFSSREIYFAMRIAHEAVRRAAAQESDGSLSDSLSSR